METPVFRILGAALCVVGIYLALRVARVRFAHLPESRMVSLGIASVSVVAFYKMLALLAIAVVPAGAVAVSQFTLLESTHAVESCGNCHVMRPMITDLRDPASGTLAARHARNWIAKDQCYECHSDYGFAGSMAAKAEGYRHLARYTSRTYEEPIVARGGFNNRNCFKCHAGTPSFEAVTSHQTARDRLDNNAMSCTNCHGQVHPTRAARTPGSPHYDRLMESHDAR